MPSFLRSTENLNPCLLVNLKFFCCISSGFARTTNIVKRWRYGIRSYFSGSHPSVWKVIANLQKDASLRKLSFFNVSSGHQFTEKKKYRVLNEKVQNFMQVYEEKTDLHFFRAMANLS